MNSVYVVYEIINTPSYHQQPSYPQPPLYTPQFPPLIQPFPSSPNIPYNPMNFVPKPYFNNNIRIVCVCKSLSTASYYCTQTPFPGRFMVGPLSIID